jgi:hypothetical protein
MLLRRTDLPLSQELVPAARHVRIHSLASAFLLLLTLSGCSQLGVYTEASCGKASGDWVVYRVKPVYTCHNLVRNKTVVSRSPCDYQKLHRCALPTEQIANNEVIRNADLYSVLTEFE